MAYFKACVYQGKELEDLKVKAGNKETKKLIGSTEWGAIRTKYFVSALIPDDPKMVRFVEISGAALDRENMTFLLYTTAFKVLLLPYTTAPLSMKK